MLQIELKVNGCIIDFVDVVNVTALCERSKSLDEHLYEVRYQDKKYGFGHNRSNGALVCAMKALEAIAGNNPSPRKEMER